MAFVAGSIAIGAGLSAAGGIAGGIVQSNAAGNAAQQEIAGANQAINFQQGDYNQQMAYLDPYRAYGQNSLSQLGSMAATAPSFTQKDFLNNMDPAYQFDLNQGLDAIQRSAAARGGLASGGTMKALNDYAQGQASNEYQNAYNRFMNNQNTQFSRLSSVAGMGQNAANSMAQLGQNFGEMIGNDYMGAANAQAAGTMAQGKIWGNALSNLGNMGNNDAMGYAGMQNQQNMMNQYLKTLG